MTRLSTELEQTFPSKVWSRETIPTPESQHYKCFSTSVRYGHYPTIYPLMTSAPIHRTQRQLIPALQFQVNKITWKCPVTHHSGLDYHLHVLPRLGRGWHLRHQAVGCQNLLPLVVWIKARGECSLSTKSTGKTLAMLLVRGLAGKVVGDQKYPR